MSTALLPLPLLLTVVGLFGLAIGSFLNVVIYRVPAGLSVVSPPSACPHCQTPIRGRDNVPVLSWLLLRGRCRDCAAPISIRYPLVEAFTGLLFAAVAARVESVPLLLAWLFVAAAGVALALIDLDCRRLPFAVTRTAASLAVSALVAGWLVAAAAGDAWWPLVWPALAGCGLWLAVYAGIWFLTAGRGMGLGDVALAPLLGLATGAVGFDSTVVGVVGGFVLGGMAGTVILLRQRLPARTTHAVAADAASGGASGTAIPFGPFMILGSWVALFAGGPVAATYLHLVGLR